MLSVWSEVVEFSDIFCTWFPYLLQFYCAEADLILRLLIGKSFWQCSNIQSVFFGHFPYLDTRAMCCVQLNDKGPHKVNTLSFCMETDTNPTSEMSYICFRKWSKGNIHLKVYRGPNNFSLKIVVTVVAFWSSLEFLYLVVLNGVVLSLKLLQTIICS